TTNTETGTVALTTNAAVVAAIGANTTATFTFTAPTAVPASYGVPGGVVVTVGLGGVSTQAELLSAVNRAIAPDAPTVAGGLGGAVALGFAVAGTAATNAGAIDISSQGGGAAAVATIA